MDTDHIENFLKIARNAQSKNQFMVRVREFDQRFLDSYPAPRYTQPSVLDRQSSGGHLQNLPPHPHQGHNTPHNQPSKNPFITNQEHFNSFNKISNSTPRTNNFLQNLVNGGVGGTHQNFYQSNSNSNLNKIPHNRSQENFYKGPSMNSINGNSRLKYQNQNQSYQQQQQVPSYSNLPRSKQFDQVQNQFGKHYISERQKQSFPTPGYSYPYSQNYHNQYSSPQIPSIISNMGELQQHQKNMGMPMGNQFLGGLNQQPDYVRYYKKTGSNPNKFGNQGQSNYNYPQSRVNPFAKN